ncbi:unnamed protein product [Allacma fusca]|uniref:Secreted protein n=1 Tax=Allacma fusca TaxID=39272 RepID=A0A8J2JQ99_9HEXA|nr:unnamed protein product [Allacma fusca]
MKKLLNLFPFVALLVQVLDSKLQIDVSVRLAEGLCEIAKKSVESKTVGGDLKQTAKPQEEDECFIWRWVRCDHNAKEKPCSTWEKRACENGGNDGSNGTDKGFCDIYQCGWTIDELHEHWGYNPWIFHDVPRDKPPNNEIIETGSTLDFPKSISS